MSDIKGKIKFYKKPKKDVIGGVQCWVYAEREIKKDTGTVNQYYTTQTKKEAEALLSKKSVNSPKLKTRRRAA